MSNNYIGNRYFVMEFYVNYIYKKFKIRLIGF